MKKSLIALAVAGTFAAPAFAATSNVDIYGKIKMSYDYIDTDVSAGGGVDDNLTRISSNSSRLGFKGSEDLGGGLKGIWQWEVNINADTVNANPRNRNTYLGLAGGFGTILLGVHDTPYKMSIDSMDVFGDTMGDLNTIMGSINGTNLFDLRASNVLAYISPNFSGFSLALARVNADESGQINGDPGAWSVAGMYNNGPLYATVAWETHEDGLAGSQNGQDLDAWRAAVGYKFGDFKVGVGYEDIDDDAAASANSRSALFINGAYAMGAITLKAQYASADDNDSAQDTGADYWAIGVDYNLSKRTKVYALYALTDNDNSATYTTGGDGAGGVFDPAAGTDPSVVSIGVEHSF